MIVSKVESKVHVLRIGLEEDELTLMKCMHIMEN